MDKIFEGKISFINFNLIGLLYNAIGTLALALLYSTTIEGRYVETTLVNGTKLYGLLGLPQKHTAPFLYFIALLIIISFTLFLISHVLQNVKKIRVFYIIFFKSILTSLIISFFCFILGVVINYFKNHISFKSSIYIATSYNNCASWFKIDSYFLKGTFCFLMTTIISFLIIFLVYI